MKAFIFLVFLTSCYGDIRAWVLMMKGVAGAPGPDLVAMWSSTGVLNENVPLANHLTTEYNGHYKPDYSNHWADYCIDRVKVSIFKNGIEKANIVFNATGTDKNGWFTKDRIIDSTYTDIRNAWKETVSMQGDLQTGREFYLSSHVDGTDPCASFGWMFVSTQSNICVQEQGEHKPQFYYASGQTQANFGISTPGKGDVFAISAHTTCSPGGMVPTKPPVSQQPVCNYNGKVYGQDATWKDGCMYNCTCEDASLGFYRCRSICPQYLNLPDTCTLVVNLGECCPKPECRHGTTAVPAIIG